MIGRVRDHLLAVSMFLTGGAALLSGLACLVNHVLGGTLLTVCPEGSVCYQSCLTQLAAGVAVFSPGLNKLKVGFFKRADPPAVAT